MMVYHIYLKFKGERLFREYEIKGVKNVKSPLSN